MEPKVIKSGTYLLMDDHGSLRMRTRYFADGSAIIVTEKTIHLVESVAKYEVNLGRSQISFAVP